MSTRRRTPLIRRRAAVLRSAALLGGAGLLAAACGSAASGSAVSGSAASGGTPASETKAARPTTTVPALRVVSVTPADAATAVSFTSPVTVTFSSPLAAGAADPTISPAVPGSWTRSGSTLSFAPTGGWSPYTHMTVTVPSGVRSAEGATLAAPVSSTWSTGAPSMLRLQQVLASLAYLPLTFTASTTPVAGSSVALPGADQQGTFAWASPNVPATLAAQWAQGQANGITRGAVMAFEADHNLAIDGSAGPQVWAALATAVAAHQTDPRPYDYITVSQTQPETLSVWQGGKVIYTSLANTGVPGAITATGTFPVYERFTTTTMRGTNPDGSKYVDPGIPWVAYFNGGDAIHGFVRSGYGYPQSDGCVELPPAHAQVMYPLDYYGTLVTVL